MPLTLAYEPRFALNAICPYFTMFPLEYPMGILKKHRKDNPAVIDPFCGRGTTLFAARALGLAAQGIDTSDVAVAIARAKLSTASSDDAVALVDELLAAGPEPEIPHSDFFRKAFHRTVLRQLCILRNGLTEIPRETEASVLLRAAVLGCLHGPVNKHPLERTYLSNQMPRTFASKPDYSVAYWKKHKLTAPNVSLRAVLKRKLDRLHADDLGRHASFRMVRHGDAQMLATIPVAQRDFSIVVTSPPYYGMNTYVADQWLRHWFLGGPSSIDYINRHQLTHTGQAAFAKSLGRVWKNMAQSRAETLHMYVRFGIVPSVRKVDAKKLMLESLESSGLRWKVVSTRSAMTAHAGRRQADQMAFGSSADTEYDFHIQRV